MQCYFYVPYSYLQKIKIKQKKKILSFYKKIQNIYTQLM